LKETDSGYYVCSTQNSQGPARDYLYLSVSKSDDRQPQQPSDDSNRRPDDSQRQPDESEQPEQPQPPSSKDSKPLVTIRAATNGAPIKLDQELRLLCFVDDSEAQIDFSRADGALDERRVRVDDRGNGVKVLTILRFEETDAGNYRCSARNRRGSSQDIAHIEPTADPQHFTFKTGSYCYNDLLFMIFYLRN
jgi:hypothetical protein